MVKFSKINFSEGTNLEYFFIISLISCFFFCFFCPTVVYHIADEIERLNKMQFLKYSRSHGYEVY